MQSYNTALNRIDCSPQSATAEARLALSVFDKTPFAVMVVDADAVIYANGTASTEFEISSTGSQSVSDLAEILAPTAQTAFLHHLAAADETNAFQTADAGGLLHRWVAQRIVVGDTSAILLHKTSTTTLDGSKHRFLSGAYAHSPHPTYVVDQTFRIIEANEAFFAFHATTISDVIGNTYANVLGHHVFEEAQPFLEEALRGRCSERTFLFGTPTGECHHFRVTYDPLNDASGHRRFALGIMREQIRLTEQQRQLDILRSAFDHVTDRISVFDRDARFVLTNKANAQVHQKKRSEMIGRTMREVLGEDRYKPIFMEQFGECLLGKSQSFSYPERKAGVEGAEEDLTPSDYHYFEAFLNPHRDSWGNIVGVVSATHDITLKVLWDIEIAAARHRFQDFAELAADWFLETDADFRLIPESSDFADLLNAPLTDLVDRTLFDILADRSIDPGLLERFKADCFKLTHPSERLDVEIEIRDDSGKTRVLMFALKCWMNANDVITSYRGVVTDYTAERTLARRLRDQAYRDTLTGVGNRRAFKEWVDETIAARASIQGSLTIACLDLDRFKQVNDSVGHQAGDALLSELTQLIQSKLTSRDKLARLGGDEFGILFDRSNLAEARATTERIIDEVAAYKFNWEGHTFQVGVSVGLINEPAEECTLSELMRKADIACYAAKNGGRNRVHVVTDDDYDASGTRAFLSLVDIERAIAEDRLHLVAMPIARLSGGVPMVDHHEVLLRTKSDTGQLLGPINLIASAEQLGVMPTVDRWIIEQTFSLIQQTGARVGINLNINLSGQSLGEASFAKWLLKRIDEGHFWPGQLCFEITETSVVRNLENAITLLDGLRDRGCRIALDDFGSGLASFAYLMKFRADYIKIDGSIITNIAEDPMQRACVKAIVGLGRAVRSETVAEYVSDQQTLDILDEIGVDMVQGYAIGHAVDLKELTSNAFLSYVEDGDLMFK